MLSKIKNFKYIQLIFENLPFRTWVIMDPHNCPLVPLSRYLQTFSEKEHTMTIKGAKLAKKVFSR